MRFHTRRDTPRPHRRTRLRRGRDSHFCRTKKTCRIHSDRRLNCFHNRLRRHRPIHTGRPGRSHRDIPMRCRRIRLHRCPTTAWHRWKCIKHVVESDAACVVLCTAHRTSHRERCKPSPSTSVMLWYDHPKVCIWYEAVAEYCLFETVTRSVLPAGFHRACPSGIQLHNPSTRLGKCMRNRVPPANMDHPNPLSALGCLPMCARTRSPCSSSIFVAFSMLFFDFCRTRRPRIVHCPNRIHLRR